MALRCDICQTASFAERRLESDPLELNTAVQARTALCKFSGKKERLTYFSMHLSINNASCEGMATAMQRRHHAADNLAE